MVLLEALFVVGVVCVVFVVTMGLLGRTQRQAAAPPGTWRTAHYDAKGSTRVVVQKVSLTGAVVLDEHVVATIPVDDPEYDARFLMAMSSARERQALFESEER